MQGYGHDESAPTPCGVFVRCFVCECGHFAVCFVGYFVGVRCTFTERSQHLHYLYVTSAPFKSMVLALKKYGFWRAKRGFLACKSMVFGVQKYGFCIAKVGVLCMLLCHSKLQVYV